MIGEPFNYSCNYVFFWRPGKIILCIMGHIYVDIWAKYLSHVVTIPVIKRLGLLVYIGIIPVMYFSYVFN